MDELNKALNNVHKERIKFYNKSVNTKISNGKQFTIIDISEFIASLKTLAILIKKHKNIDHDVFIKQNLEKFKYLKNTLVGDDRVFFNKYYDSDVQNKLTNYYNKIIIPINYNTIITKKEKFITKTFTHFISGITFFKNENQELRWPVYHRDKSCGTNRLTSDYKFKKTLFGPNPNKIIEKCYIERTIYDILYKHIIGVQDFGHMVEYKVVSNFYQNSFPHYIDINLDYESDIYPTRLTIKVKSSSTNRLIERYEYIKRLDNNKNYIDNVVCFKIDYESKIEYKKEQTYDDKKKWKRIT